MRSILACGYLLLDAIIDSSSADVVFHAGGSAGNVSAILARLGWNSSIAATLGEDKAADLIRRDLASCGISQNLIYTSESVTTPCVLQRNVWSDGALRTRFSRVCQQCGSPFPRLNGDSLSKPLRAARELPAPTVFYADFDSRESAETAHYFARQASLVVFDAIRCNDPQTFASLCSAAHLVKYSDEWVPNAELRAAAPLELWTRGTSGVMWRRHGQDWQQQSLPHPVQNGDVVGSGDCFISGFLDALAACSSGDLRGAISSDSILSTALDAGQKLAASNCGKLGARGFMYGEEDVLSTSAPGPQSAAIEKHFVKDSTIPPELRQRLGRICLNCSIAADSTSA